MAGLVPAIHDPATETSLVLTRPRNRNAFALLLAFGRSVR